MAEYCYYRNKNRVDCQADHDADSDDEHWPEDEPGEVEFIVVAGAVMGFDGFEQGEGVGEFDGI